MMLMIAIAFMPMRLVLAGWVVWLRAMNELTLPRPRPRLVAVDGRRVG